MSRKSKLNSLEIELASSILYYDKEEMQRFFDIYDSISADSNIVIDGTFDLFVRYLKKFTKFDADPAIRRQSLIDEINIRNNQNPDANVRENFEIWLDKVLETEAPLELAEDILYHLVWEEYKKAIDTIDKSKVGFKEKLAVRPKVQKMLDQDEIIDLDTIRPKRVEVSEEYTTGLEELDKTLKFAKCNFAVIAARPGVGKSLLMLLMAIANARKGVKTLFLSLEMDADQIDARIVNHYHGESLKDKYSDEDGVLDFDAYDKAYMDIKSEPGYKGIKDNLKLFVSKSKSADSILAKIEDLIKHNGYKAVFIDYLQLLKFSGMDEWASIRALTPALKSIAFRTKTLIVTGSQVSRSSTEKGLYLTDLFGSSSIESDTDVVLGIESVRERKRGENALVNVKIMKHREGDLADIKYMIDYSVGRLHLHENY